MYIYLYMIYYPFPFMNHFPVPGAAAAAAVAATAGPRNAVPAAGNPRPPANDGATRSPPRCPRTPTGRWNVGGWEGWLGRLRF